MKNRYTFFTGQILVWDMEWTKENIKTTGELNQSRVHGLRSLPNSMQVIPKDQMSIFPSYWPSSIARITSGAILRKHPHFNDRYTAFDLMENIEWDCRWCPISKFFPIFQTPSIFSRTLGFWNSPIWRPHKRVGWRDNGGRTKICKFHLARLCQQDVPCLNISVRQTNRGERLWH